MNSGPGPSGTGARREGTTRHQACGRCWKRKQKCDRKLPQCTACKTIGAECTSRAADTVNSSEESSLPHGGVPSYFESLKRKVEELEEQALRNKRSRSNITVSNGPNPGAISQRPNPSPGRSVFHDGATPASTSSSHAPPRRDLETTEEGPVQATMREISFLSRSAMGERRDDVEDLPRQLSLEKTIMAAVAVDGPDPSHASYSNSHISLLVVPDTHSLHLNREATIAYMTRFLDDISMFFPHISSLELMEHYEALVTEHARQSGTDTLDRHSRRTFDVLMAIAIGTLMSPASNRVQSFTLQLHAAAMRMLPSILKSADGFDAISSMIYLIVYSIFSPHGGSAWHLVGLAMKRAVSLRLHKEPTQQAGTPLPFIDQRRRLFWTLYLLDRSLCTVMDRPFSIQDEDISTNFPDHQDHSANLPHHLIMQVKLISSIRGSIPQEMISDYTNVSYWRSLSLDLTHTSMPKRVSSYLDQLYCRSLIQVLQIRPLLSGSKGNIICSSQRVNNEIITSCKIFIDDVYDQSEQGNFVGSFIDAYDIFAAGTVFICLYSKAQARPEQAHQEVMSITNKASTLLTVIGEQFPALKVFRKLLWALSSQAHGGPQQDHQQSLQRTILYDLPTIVPGRIRNVIRHFLGLDSDLVGSEPRP